MNQILAAHLRHNTGGSAAMKQSQVTRVSATTIVDFMYFKLQYLRERFDQARTKDGDHMDPRFAMDLLVATGTCPDLALGGKAVDAMIYQP